MRGFLADMRTFTLEEAAALVANKYGWHESARKTLQQQLLEASKDGTLISAPSAYRFTLPPEAVPRVLRNSGCVRSEPLL